MIADAGNRTAGELWRPTASLPALRKRAEVLATIRSFFAAREVLEVETPALSAATVSDLHLDSFVTQYRGPGSAAGHSLYLQTSPEYAMKRLLAAGSGPIYQLAKAFRDGEASALHNPEFTMLEWYRPGFAVADLLDEIDALLTAVLACAPAERRTYGELFATICGVDPHRASGTELRRAYVAKGGAEVVGVADDDRDVWLQLLMTEVIEPQLGRPASESGDSSDSSGSSRSNIAGRRRATFVTDYPASQAALAQLVERDDGVVVAERFEVYVEGVELANGFHELADAAEQRQRFKRDHDRRQAVGKVVPPVDEHLLAALASGGFPDCCGVALGVDRLVMLALGVPTIAEVVAFPIDRA